jgi:hypothetical protein
MHGDATNRIERLRAHHQREILVWQEKLKVVQTKLDHAHTQLRDPFDSDGSFKSLYAIEGLSRNRKFYSNSYHKELLRF